MKHIIIDTKEAKMIIENFDSLPIEYEKTYLFKDGEKWIGIDNSTAECWVEEFDNIDDCISWLNGEFEVE